MAVDPFNSVGGYTVGIPPIPIIDANGNLTVPKANLGGVTVANNIVVGGRVDANLFVGTFSGNITGNLVVPGSPTQVIFNLDGQAGADAGFTFDKDTQTTTVVGNLVAGSFTIGSGLNQFSTSSVVFYSTFSSAPEQVLHRITASEISSIDYIIIATDNIANNRQITKLFAGKLGTEVEYFEVGTIEVPRTGPGVGDFKVRYISGNIELTVDPFTSNYITYKVMVTSYKE